MTTNHSNTPPLNSHQGTEHLISWLRDYSQRRINSRLIDERRCITPHIVLDFGKQGLLGMIIPKSYGGLGLTYNQMFQIIEQLAAIDISLATFVGLNNVLGIYPILKYGNEQTKTTYLKSLATGRDLAAFAITEPHAGSNPNKIQTQAIPNGNGKWLINGTKIWSGSASWSSVMTVFAKIVDEKGRASKTTAFVIPENARGLKHGPEALTMGMRGMVQNSIYFEQVPVNDENVLGEIGSGFEVAQGAMRLGRLGIAAICIGGMKRCAQLMFRYGSRRSIDMMGSDKLLDKQITLKRLGDINAAITAIECFVKTMANLLDQEKTVYEEAYLTAKIIAPELMWKTADNLIQLLGGRGYIESNIAPQILRDVRLLRIFEGPTETVRNYLGLLALYQMPSLSEHFNDLLKASEISSQLQEIGKVCLAHINNQNLSLKQKKILREILANELGELTAWAFILGSLEKSYRDQQTNKIKQSQIWVKHQFSKKVAGVLDILEQPLETITSLSANEVSEVISEYAREIGDLEQTLPGEDEQLDEYIFRDLNP
ncbi:MAG: acyl-CoA dehydrogenase family protein [Crocosphaera sp.]